MTNSDQPNYLFFIVDQMRADHLGFAGNPIVRTPSIDRLASAGSWWSRFYVASPTCMSNRASFMTGRMPSVHGVRHNGIPLDLSSVTFVDLLRSAGYRTALVGKSHLQGITTEPPKFARRQFRGDLTPPPPELSEAMRSAWPAERYTSEMAELWERDPSHAEVMPKPYYGFEDVLLCSGHGDVMSGDYAAWLKKKGFSGEMGAAASDESAATDAPQTYKPALPEELYPTSYIAEHAIEKLEDFAAGDAPFFLQCSFPDPHHPFTPPGEYWDMFSPDDMILPHSFYEPNKHAVPPMSYMWDLFDRGEPQKRWTWPFVAGEAQGKEMMAKTFGQIAMIDDSIGRVLAKLEEVGSKQNTVVCFMSDHGDYLGDHGLFLKGPINYQSIIRTPFIWLDPDQAKNLGEQRSPASTIDIATTVLYRSGLMPANGMQGMDIFSEKRADDDGILVELTTSAQNYLGLDETISVSTIVQDNWRLSVWENQIWGELYNLRDDPGELVNLWSDPEYLTKKHSLMLNLIFQMQSCRESSPHPLSVA